MFYEIKEKRVKSGSHAKWWLTAALSAVVITVTFMAFIFWLGVAVRQPESNSNFVADRFPAARDYPPQPYKGSSSTPPAPKPTVAPKLDYPTAEILKTTIKNKKGRVEMVEVNSGSEADKLPPSKAAKHATVERVTTGAPPSVEMEIDDFDSFFAEEESPPDEVQLRSRISKLAFAQSDARGGADHLKDGVNPLEEVSAALPVAENNSVKKKSEAVLPSWYDPGLQNSAAPAKPEPSNHLKPDTAYDLPDFSQIKPDLSAFNTKTIPAFTYLKEPLPQFDNLPDTPNGDGDDDDDSSVDDSYYYQQTTTTTTREPNHHRKQEKKPHHQNSFMSLLQKRLHTVQDWLLYGTRKNRSGIDLMEMVKTLNNTFQNKNLGMFFSRLNDMYANFNASDVQNMAISGLLYPTSPSVLHNSSSLVSFGLLAIDLFLLHNVQQIVWNEEAKIGEEMLKDPDVLALNALFMSPDRVQQLRQSNSRIFKDNEKKGVVHELMEFINSGLRAMLNLSKAYKSSTSKLNARSSTSGSTLDCIWTLYCRNLDKTAKLQGPYGFLAKMNR